jgi:hypothetical protein
VLAVAAAILLLLAGASLFSGTVRDAVADALGIPGIRIEIDRDESTATAVAPADLSLGPEIPLAEIPDYVGFMASMLYPDDYGLPDAVYARTLPDGTPLLSLAYVADDRLPNTAETGLGMLVMEFEARSGVQSMVKSMLPDGRMETIEVNGMFGYWVEGATRLQILGDGSVGRASGNVLLWQANGITFRMESALTMDEAIDIAEEMTVIHASLLTPTAEP